MFCKNCGAELKPGQRFCGKCGSKQDDAAQPTQQAPRAQPQAPRVQPQAPRVPNQPTGMPNQAPRVQPRASYGGASTSVASVLSNPIAILYIVTAALFALQILLWFTPTIDITFYSDYELEYSLFDLADNIDAGIFFVVAPIVLLDLGAITMCVLPFILRTVTKRNRLILPKIAAIYSAVWYFLLLTEYLSEDYVGLTVGGVLLVFVCAGLIALSFVLSALTKKYSRG